MKTLDIVMVRVYITEASQLPNKIVDYLKNDEISGLSVFRAIEGVGQSGSLTSSLLDLSLNLPISIEFFDYDKAKIEKARALTPNRKTRPYNVLGSKSNC